MASTNSTKATTSDDALPPYSATSQIGTCHCKAVSIIIPHAPTTINECQCSICYRYGALWAYYPSDEVLVTAEAGKSTVMYAWGKREIEFHRCSNCGNMTHWWASDRSDPKTKMGVNTRMLDRAIMEGVERRVSPGPE